MPTAGKLYLGSIEISGGAGPADFSNAATGTYSSGGKNYKYVRFTGSSSLTITRDGLITALIVGGGGGGGRGIGQVYVGAGAGSGDAYYSENLYLLSGTYSVGIGGGAGEGGTGGASFIRSGHFFSIAAGGTGTTTGSMGGSNTFFSGANYAVFPYAGGGAGSTASGSTRFGGAGFTSSITGASVTYASGGPSGGSSAAANTGNGAGGGDVNGGRSGGSGVIVIRVEV
jgi:hypothetical protein